ncbi:MAG: hypothetical protein IJ215_02255 [Clostridia bacterium]|nr:hypothetical protein [Clostridia bacterium]
MNLTTLKAIINEYKKQISGTNNIDAIKERNARKDYYQSWTKTRIQNMNEDEFVEYIGKLWSMLVWGNKKYIADKIIESNGFEHIKEQLIALLYGKGSIIQRWNEFYRNIKHIGPSSMSELLSYIDPEEYVICNKVTCECFSYLGIEGVPVYNYQYK